MGRENGRVMKSIWSTKSSVTKENKDNMEEKYWCFCDELRERGAVHYFSRIPNH